MEQHFTRRFVTEVRMSKSEYERAEQLRQRKKKRKAARNERKERVEQKHMALKREPKE